MPASFSQRVRQRNSKAAAAMQIAASRYRLRTYCPPNGSDILCKPTNNDPGRIISLGQFHILSCPVGKEKSIESQTFLQLLNFPSIHRLSIFHAETEGWRKPRRQEGNRPTYYYSGGGGIGKFFVVSAAAAEPNEAFRCNKDEVYTLSFGGRSFVRGGDRQSGSMQ